MKRNVLKTFLESRLQKYTYLCINKEEILAFIYCQLAFLSWSSVLLLYLASKGGVSQLNWLVNTPLTKISQVNQMTYSIYSLKLLNKAFVVDNTTVFWLCEKYCNTILVASKSIQLLNIVHISLWFWYLLWTSQPIYNVTGKKGSERFPVDTIMTSRQCQVIVDATAWHSIDVDVTLTRCYV